MRGSRDPRQQLSKRLYNSEHRLTIVQALLDQNGFVAAADLAQQLGIARSTVHTELYLLDEIGALQRVQPDRTVLFQKIDGLFWAWNEELLLGIAQSTVAPPHD